MLILSFVSSQKTFFLLAIAQQNSLKRMRDKTANFQEEKKCGQMVSKCVVKW